MQYELEQLLKEKAQEELGALYWQAEADYNENEYARGCIAATLICVCGMREYVFCGLGGEKPPIFVGCFRPKGKPIEN